MSASKFSQEYADCTKGLPDSVGHWSREEMLTCRERSRALLAKAYIQIDHAKMKRKLARMGIFWNGEYYR